MPTERKVSAVYDIKSVEIENGREKFHSVGKVVHYEDGIIKMKLSMFPGTKFKLFESTKRR